MSPSLLTICLTALAVVVIAMVLTALAAWRTGHVSVVDVTWGLLFVAIAWAVLGVGEGSDRSWLLAVLVTAWGVRLAWHIGTRAARSGQEDPRYVQLLGDGPIGERLALAARKVFLVQGAAAWFISLPLMVAAATDRPLGIVAAIGVIVWLVGLAFEVVGDAQLKAFKADAANTGQIMDQGLWSWTRHPNYFGDACMWFGLWIITAEAWPGVLTVLSPVAMTCFLAFATGARLLERSMAKRPGYPEYMARTSGFVPWPPTKHQP